MKNLLLLIFITFGAIAEASPREMTDTVNRVKTVLRADTVVEYDTIVRRRTIITEDFIYRSGEPVPVPKTKPVASPVRSGASGETPLSGQPAERNSVIQAPASQNSPISADIPGVTAPSAVKTSAFAIFRGDTIPMLLHDKNLGRFDRGLSNHLYIPRGMWQFGVTASYGEFSTEDLEVLDLLSDIDLGGRIVSVRPYFSYFIRNNLSVGMRLGYTSGKAHVGSFKVDIDDDMNFNLHDIAYNSESYSAAVTLRQYYGITRRGRFGIFNEVDLSVGSGNSDFVRPYNGVLKSTHTKTVEGSLNFSPGVSVFVMEKVCFNLSFGVFGFNIRHDKQTEDGVPMGERTTSGANFRFNIFNINFGLAVTL